MVTIEEQQEDVLRISLKIKEIISKEEKNTGTEIIFMSLSQILGCYTALHLSKDSFPLVVKALKEYFDKAQEGKELGIL